MVITGQAYARQMELTVQYPIPKKLTCCAEGTPHSTLEDIYHYLTNPDLAPASRNFLRKVVKYFAKAGQLFKRTKSGHPLLVIFDTTK
jgi:hypothetical protein